MWCPGSDVSIFDICLLTYFKWRYFSWNFSLFCACFSLYRVVDFVVISLTGVILPFVFSRGVFFVNSYFGRALFRLFATPQPKTKI